MASVACSKKASTPKCTYRTCTAIDAAFLKPVYILSLVDRLGDVPKVENVL